MRKQIGTIGIGMFPVKVASDVVTLVASVYDLNRLATKKQHSYCMYLSGT